MGSSTARVVVAAGLPTVVQERQRLRLPYPNFKVVVLDDDVNTFQHVVECLVRYIPGMQPDQAWNLAHCIDSEGSAVVWCGAHVCCRLGAPLPGVRSPSVPPPGCAAALVHRCNGSVAQPG